MVMDYTVIGELGECEDIRVLEALTSRKWCLNSRVISRRETNIHKLYGMCRDLVLCEFPFRTVSVEFVDTALLEKIPGSNVIKPLNGEQRRTCCLQGGASLELHLVAEFPEKRLRIALDLSALADKQRLSDFCSEISKLVCQFENDKVTLEGYLSGELASAAD